MLANLKISARLALLVTTLVAALVGVGGYGLYALQQSEARNAASLELSRDLMQAVDAARGAEVAFKIQVQEFKNILLRGHTASDYDRYLAAFEKRRVDTTRELAETRAMLVKLGLPADGVDEAVRIHGEISGQYVESLKKFSQVDVESGQLVDSIVRGKDRPLEQKMDAIVLTLETFAGEESARIASTGAAETRRVTLGMAGALAAVLLVAIVLGVRVTRSVSGPIRQAAAAAERVAAGDLTLQLEAHGRDEAAQMIRALARMTENLRGLVSDVAQGARTVAATSGQIAQGSVDLSQRTEEQASTLQQTASSMEELTATVTQNADTARQARQLAVDASEVARRGGEVVGHVVATMDGISASSTRISDIIGVIDDIAFQTNILALNAAVEAARAGEQGRGFAVVAAEVRSLAQRSAGAAREIKALIVESVEQVGAGGKLVDAAGRTMGQVVESVRKVSDLIAEIAAASEEQSSGIEQVNIGVTRMDQVVQHNASLVEEAAAATEAMKEQADVLLDLVSRFTLAREEQVAVPLPDAVASAPRALPGGYLPSLAID
jgi:methyl-accepting chemotaxis protein-1 (serine sensor receptor)